MIHIDENYFNGAKQASDDITNDIEQSTLSLNLDAYPWEIRLSFRFLVYREDGFQKMKVGQFDKLFRKTISYISDNDIFVSNSFKLISQIEKDSHTQEDCTSVYTSGEDLTHYIEKHLTDFFEGELVHMYDFTLSVSWKIDTDDLFFNMWKTGLTKILNILYRVTKPFNAMTINARSFTTFFMLCNVDDFRQDNVIMQSGTVSSWEPFNMIMLSASLLGLKTKSFSVDRIKNQRTKLVANQAYRYTYYRALESDSNDKFDVELVGYTYDPVKFYFKIKNKNIDIQEITDYFIDNYIDKFDVTSIMNMTKSFNREYYISFYIFPENADYEYDNTRLLDDLGICTINKTYSTKTSSFTVPINFMFLNNKIETKSSLSYIKAAEYAKDTLEQDKKAGVL